MALITIPRPTLRVPAAGPNGENRHLIFTGSVIFKDEPRGWYFRGKPSGKREETVHFKIALQPEGITVLSAPQIIPVHVTLADVGNDGTAKNARWACITRVQGTFDQATQQIDVQLHLIVNDTGPGMESTVSDWINSEAKQLPANESASQNFGMGLLIVNEISTLIRARLFAKPNPPIGPSVHIIFSK